MSMSKQPEISLKDYLEAESNLEKLREENGIKISERGFKKLITNFFEWKENRVKVQVSRKKYIILATTLGWIGIHRFYSRRYVLGIIYFLLFWTGIPFAMTLIDLMIALPLKQDERGMILI